MKAPLGYLDPRSWHFSVRPVGRHKRTGREVRLVQETSCLDASVALYPRLQAAVGIEVQVHEERGLLVQVQSPVGAVYASLDAWGLGFRLLRQAAALSWVRRFCYTWILFQLHLSWTAEEGPWLRGGLLFDENDLGERRQISVFLDTALLGPTHIDRQPVAVVPREVFMPDLDGRINPYILNVEVGRITTSRTGRLGRLLKPQVSGYTDITTESPPPFKGKRSDVDGLYSLYVPLPRLDPRALEDLGPTVDFAVENYINSVRRRRSYLQGLA